MGSEERRPEVGGIEGVIYIVRRGDQYLIAKRVKENSNFFNQFLFPGGLIEEFDQNPQESVSREVKEERGADIHISKFIEKISYPHPNGYQITQHVFLIDEGDYEGEMGNMEPDKEQLFWMKRDELKQVCTSEPAKAVLKLLEEKGIFTEVK